MSQAAFYQTIPESNNVAIDPQGVRYIDPNPVQYVLTPAPILTPVNPYYVNNNQPQKVVYVREESPESEVVYIKRTPRPRVTIITPDPKDRRVYTVMEDDDDEEEEEEEEEEEDEVIYIRRTPSRKVYQVKESYDDVPARVDTFRSGYKSIGGDVEIFDEKKTPKSKSKVESFNKQYVRNGGDVEIFDEPINHRIKSRVDSHNYGYAPKGGDVEIFDDKSRPYAKPKVDSFKRNYVKSGGDIEIFDEKLNFRSRPRVDTRNTSYSRNGGNVEVFSERPSFLTGPRIETFNKNYVRQGGNVKVFSEKIDVNATPRVDDRNLNYKKLGGNVQVFSEKVEVRNIDPVVDTKNPNYRKPASNVKDNVDFELEPESRPQYFKSPENADDQETSAFKQTRNHQNYGENKNSRKKKKTNNPKRRIKRSNSPEFSSKINEQKMAPKKKPVVEQTLKILENLGFKDPNIKNVKSKVSTWNSAENMHPTKPHLSYLNQYRTRDLQLSPDSKVKNWLSSSVPQSPTENFSIDNKKTQKKKENVLPNIKAMPKNPRRNEELPKQKKSSVKNASPRNDQWVQEDSNYNRNRTYDKNSKLPQISNKQMYEMVNTLTNRKPVKIAENDDIFDKFKTAKERDGLGEPLALEETLVDEKETQDNAERQELNE